MARFSYRLAFVAAATTYGIVVYKTFKSRAKAGARNPGVIGLAADENVQYLGMPFSSAPILAHCHHP
jgi:hypothetical protein